MIVNPVAGRGKTKHDLSEIRSAFAWVGVVDFRATEAAGDEERIARSAIAAGTDTLIAVGGDGTCNKVANTILRSRTSCRLGVVPTGTGNDFAKMLGVQTLPIADIAALVARGSSTPIDVGRVDENHFLNSCGFGFDASVLEATRQVPFLKGDAVYIYSALRQLLTYRGVHVGIGPPPGAEMSKMLMVTVSNGRFLGGAFRIAPHASMIDGELDVGFIGDTSLIGRVRIFVGALRGTHVGLPSVRTARAKTMTLCFSDSPKMEVDGELCQARSSTVEIECLPRALSVIAASGYPR